MLENKDPTIKLFGKKIPLTADADDDLSVTALEKEKCRRVEVEDEEEENEEYEEEEETEKVQWVRSRESFKKFWGWPIC